MSSLSDTYGNPQQFTQKFLEALELSRVIERESMSAECDITTLAQAERRLLDLARRYGVDRGTQPLEMVIECEGQFVGVCFSMYIVPEEAL